MRSIVAGSGARRPFDREAGGDPGADHLVHERLELRGARLGRESLALLRAQHAEQAPHLTQRLAARVADRAQRGGGLRRPLRGARRRAVRLHDHHRQRVRDDIVQLAGDPGALARGADRRLLIALERQQPVALLQRGDLGPPRAPPRAQRRRQQRGDHRGGRDLQQREPVAALVPARGPERRSGHGARRRRGADPRLRSVGDDRVHGDQRDDAAGDDVVEHRELREAQHADHDEHGHGRPPAERQRREQRDRERQIDDGVALRREIAGQHEREQQRHGQQRIARDRPLLVPAREPGDHLTRLRPSPLRLIRRAR